MKLKHRANHLQGEPDLVGATGQVGSNTIDYLVSEENVEIIAAVRSPEKEATFKARGIATVILDLDEEGTQLPVLEGVDTRRCWK